MNCLEAQALVEDALDNALAGSRKRALDLHLSRCDACRAFFDAERNEHRRWFQAMNDPESLRRLPNGFAEQFTVEMAKRHAAPQRKWALVRAFRRIAAVLAAMLLFAGLSYAAVVAIDGLRGTEAANQDAVEGVTDVTGGTTVASDAPQSTELTAPIASDSVGRAAPSASQLSEIGTIEAQECVSLVSQVSPVSQSTPQGATTMTRKKAAAAALTAAMAAAPLAAANGDESPFILSGDPVAAATVRSSSASSDEIALETGALRVAGTADDLEARSRTKGTSVAIALNATKLRAFIMTFR